MKYPSGTKFNAYFVAPEASGYCIKRMITYPDGRPRSAQRYPKKKYANITSKSDLEALCVRLNGRENRRAIETIKTKLAFLPTSLLEEFREQLNAEIPTEKDAKLHYQNLHRYFLKFFVDTMKLKDPIEWKSQEIKWGLALLSEPVEIEGKKVDVALFSDHEKRSPKTVSGIIHTANRFMAFLHKKLPREISYIKLEPISKARFKDYKATWKLLNAEPGKYIKDAHWTIIEAKLPPDIAPFIKLGYYYGLRRAETLGFSADDVYHTHLDVRLQLVAMPNSGPIYDNTKGRAPRKVPHWFGSPDLAYEWIEAGQSIKMHQDTLGEKFIKFVKTLDMDYETHDLRRTFITRALDIAKPVDVMLAAGHGDINTTMKYVRDKRDLSTTRFKPKRKDIG